METYKITQITLNRNIDGDDKAYEATITINDEFVVQVSGDDKEATFWGVPDSSDAFHADHKKQDLACENIDKDEIEKILEEQEGFENNLGWLEDNADIEL